MVLPVWPIWRSDVTQPFCTSGREQPIFGAEHARELPDQLEIFRRSEAEPAGDDDVGIASAELRCLAVRQKRQHLGDDIVLDHAERMLDDALWPAVPDRSGIAMTRGRTVAICGR